MQKELTNLYLYKPQNQKECDETVRINIKTLARQTLRQYSINHSERKDRSS